MQPSLLIFSNVHLKCQLMLEVDRTEGKLEKHGLINRDASHDIR